MADERKPYGNDDDNEDEPELRDEDHYRSVKDAVLFAIEVSNSMLQQPSEFNEKKPDTGLPPVLAALKCAYTLMQQRIISNPKDAIGVLLYGTKQSRFSGEADSGTLQYPHCYVLTDLAVPAAEDVRTLRDVVQDEEEREILQASDENVNISNVLFCANQIFTTQASDFASRRLFLVTDNDDPHKDAKELSKQAVVRAKDLYDLGVTIELFPISHPDRGYSFDRNKFYNDIIYNGTTADSKGPAPFLGEVKPASSVAKDGMSLLQNLLQSIASRAVAQRAVANNLPFEIAPGLKITVRLFHIMNRQKIKHECWVYLPKDDDKPMIVTSKQNRLAEDTAAIVEKSEIKKAFKVGADKVVFTDEELNQIKLYGEPLLRIIGFKPLDQLEAWAVTKESTFMWPSEEVVIGSRRVYTALHGKLLKDKKVAIAWYRARRNSSPLYVAILASEERTNSDGVQISPGGLWLRPLPFANDLRHPEITKMAQPPDSVVQALQPVIEQLKLPGGIYDATKYPNPALQWFYKNLQALALDDEAPQGPPEDKTVPRFKQINKRAGPYIAAYAEELNAAYDWWANENKGVIAAPAPKRSMNAAGPNKKIKQEDGDGPTEEEMKQAYDQDTLSNLTVATLKSFAQSKGLSMKGKKADLVNAITSYFETR